MSTMDNKERTAAANALIGWCNSQNLTPSDTEAVLAKVLAKIFVNRIGTGPTEPYALHKIVQAFDHLLVHETNERAYHVRRIR